jgi:hypothetical protein
LGKTTRSRGESTKIRELTSENKKLRRELLTLRRQVARLDVDRFSYVRDIVEEHLTQEEQEISTKDMLASLKSTWTCKKCKTGHLEILLFSRRDGTHYLRQCTDCPHRTKMQLYTPEVKGPMKPEPEPEGK